MKNDRKIKSEIQAIFSLAQEFLGEPNPTAYSDRIVEQIIEHSDKLKKLSDEQFSNNN